MVVPPGHRRTIMDKQKHLNLDSRSIIEYQLNQNNSFKGIAKILGKDCTTVSKEVKNHICFEKSGAYSRAFNDCQLAYLHQCHAHKICSVCTAGVHRPCWSCGRCTSHCSAYKPFTCPRLSKPPYVCNGCKERSKCSLEKRFYRASYAQKEYELTRSEARSGLAVSEIVQHHLRSPLQIRLAACPDKISCFRDLREQRSALPSCAR